MGAFVLDASFARENSMSTLFDKNGVIINDWFIAESYKTGSLLGLQRNLEVISRNISKTYRLKNFNELSGLQLYAGDPRIAMIDAEQSLRFHAFVERILAASPGDEFDLLVAEKRGQTEAHMNKLAEIFSGLGSQLERMTKAWTVEGRTLFLSNPKVLPKKLIDSIVPVVHEICDGAFKGVNWPSNKRHQIMMFDFRVVLCLNIALLKRAFKGNAKGVGAEKLRNDLVDCFQIALGTYFNGILTTDKGAIWVGRFATKLLYQLDSMPQLPKGMSIGEHLHS